MAPRGAISIHALKDPVLNAESSTGGTESSHFGRCGAGPDPVDCAIDPLYQCRLRNRHALVARPARPDTAVSWAGAIGGRVAKPAGKVLAFPRACCRLGQGQTVITGHIGM